MQEPAFLGVVLPGERVDLSATAAGRLKHLCCQVGERVVQGMEVATLEAQELQQSLRMAEAALQAAAAELAKATVELEEAQERLERRSGAREGALSVEELSTVRYQQRLAQVNLTGARARHGEQQARVAQLRLGVQQTRLVAPFSGAVAVRYAEPGAVLAAGVPVLQLVSVERPRIRFAIPQSAVAGLGPGRPVAVRVTPGGQPLRATVESVAPELDAASGMVFLLARLEAPDEPSSQVLAGMTVRVSGIR